MNMLSITMCLSLKALRDDTQLSASRGCVPQSRQRSHRRLASSPNPSPIGWRAALGSIYIQLVTNQERPEPGGPALDAIRMISKQYIWLELFFLWRAKRSSPLVRLQMA
jgi:hypothetical protein